MEYLVDGTLSAEVTAQIVGIEKQIADLKAKEDEMKSAIKDAMVKSGIVKIENDSITISYIAPTTQERIDTKELKADLPQIYNTYCKISDKADYIKIKVKE